MNIWQNFKKSFPLLRRLAKLPRRIDCLQRAAGRIEWRQLQMLQPREFNAYEFQVYSQWGEDGLIQYLIHKVPIINRSFIEFGVEDYTECNTRFLLENNNWTGLIMDGSEENARRIKQDSVYRTRGLQAICAFISVENINDLLQAQGMMGDIGLLSVDVDGNDYWIWKAITVVNPRIVICEYNSLFGSTRKVTIPYRADFIRRREGAHIRYYGASLAALENLAIDKGYILVGVNSAGNNAFFAREDVAGNLQQRSATEVYARAQFKECSDNTGNPMTYSDAELRAQLADLPLYDIETDQIIKMRELNGHV